MVGYLFDLKHHWLNIYVQILLETKTVRFPSGSHRILLCHDFQDLVALLHVLRLHVSQRCGIEHSCLALATDPPDRSGCTRSYLRKISQLEVEIRIKLLALTSVS